MFTRSASVGDWIFSILWFVYFFLITAEFLYPFFFFFQSCQDGAFHSDAFLHQRQRKVKYPDNLCLFFLNRCISLLSPAHFSLSIAHTSRLTTDTNKRIYLAAILNSSPVLLCSSKNTNRNAKMGLRDFVLRQCWSNTCGHNPPFWLLQDNADKGGNRFSFPRLNFYILPGVGLFFIYIQFCQAI